MSQPPLAPHLTPLAGLVGTWRGQGKGKYPTIKDFEYGEEVKIWHYGGPFLLYLQRTWSTAENKPLHSESGFVRFPKGRPGTVELVLAQPSGISSVEVGSIETLADGKVVISLSAEEKDITRTPTSTPPHVKRYARKWTVTPGTSFLYEFDMETDNTPMTRHLDATLIPATDA
eukprot:Opistho-2@1404